VAEAGLLRLLDGRSFVSHDLRESGDNVRIELRSRPALEAG
jgi:hypothetical protein